MATKKAKTPIPDAERCVSVNVSQIRERRCPQRASGTLTHPDLRTPQRLCPSHAKEYKTGVRIAQGWVWTPDAESEQ